LIQVNAMELLIIKTEKNYIGFKDGEYIVCGLDKASVFPLKQIESVRNHVKNLKELRFQTVSISKLTITESPFIPNDK